MSVTEILVLIGGLGLGYWVVSKLYDDLYRDRRPAQPPADEEATNRSNNSSESEKGRDKR